MISQDEARARVARGAAHLDQVRPGWFTEIDTGTLTLHDSCGCIVGQLCGTWRPPIAVPAFAPMLRALGLSHVDGSSYGFNMEKGSGEDVWRELFRTVPLAEATAAFYVQLYRPLQDAWIEAIADRRLSQSVGEPAHVAAVDRPACSTGTPVHAREDTHV